MPRRATLAAATAVVACAAWSACTPPSPVSSGATSATAAGAPFDVIIANGKIVDGSGNAWFYGDVAIAGDRIVRIAPRGMLNAASARRRIDATGLVVAPGVIDIQAQSYVQLLTGDSRVVSM
ncbi:MAG: hypothetical protein ACREPM_16775, partial [Gemmatimonadaceae bacterium]